ncbi:hypothetical protein SRB17_26140 [Streptomyces sp. RB17]|uniref:hypothetical protein n=1 Tax=Streptomyces sp. RB17 TaxID=2585197 RepID=UPI0012957D4F|nr:hypothetical protein [Streptomyces sp. RB17]MQY34644.1 hypothetical protein [Streptomyces sp. RB17]
MGFDGAVGEVGAVGSGAASVPHDLAYLALERAADARPGAAYSLAERADGTPGRVAASPVLAPAEAADAPEDAAQRADDGLERIPATRLRSTAQTGLPT